MKRVYTVIFILILAPSVYASKPLIGVTGIGFNSTRTKNVALLIETHIGNIFETTGIFDAVKSSQLKSELAKFNCLEEKCILRFAKEADISMIVRGELEDKVDHMILTLYSYGTEMPYQGKIVYSIKISIPLVGKYYNGTYNLISEEHAANFVAGVLEKFRVPVYIDVENNSPFLKTKEYIDGKYTLFRVKPPASEAFLRFSKKISEITIKNGKIEKIEKIKKTDIKIKKDDYILLNYRKEGTSLRELYSGRKKEIVLQESGIEDPVYKILFTVPASASMPISAPVLGYFASNDWKGLTLWAVNAAPYLYMEVDGLYNSPGSYRDDKKDVPGSVLARNRFAWYMLFAGGMSLFVDAFSGNYLGEAANYQGIKTMYRGKHSFYGGQKPLMGNSLSAGYLALIAGGGGHFYRGERAWGYFYFHLHNILLYLTINEFSPGETYNAAAGTYETGTIDNTRAYTLLGIFSAVKIVEIIHAVLLKDVLRNGRVLEENFDDEDSEDIAIIPLVYTDNYMALTVGVQCRYRF